MINLLQALSNFPLANDRESETVYYRTHVPWVGPLAYLHIIFKPAPKAALESVGQRLAMPRPLKEFLARQNGVILFSGALCVDGVHRDGQLLNRSDPFLDQPFNIEWENSNYPPHDPDRLLAFGGYGFDGSTICIDRSDFRVYLFKRGDRGLVAVPSGAWDSIEHWITGEIARLSVLFDSTGKRLVDEALTVLHEGPPS